MHTVKTGSVVFGVPRRLVLIGGPCVIESEKSAFAHAEQLMAITRRMKIPFVFKSSYDKANRSSRHSYRGPGIQKGLEILARIQKTFRVPVLSDAHSVDEIKRAAEVLDIIQIPAFLCRQTDMLIAAARTRRIVNIKKGQFLSPWEMSNLIEKVASEGNKNILITERGFSFGYNNLVSDFRSIPIMRDMGYPVVFDATHSVQMPGGLGASSGGRSEFVPVLARCAAAAGADALFIEVHTNPSRALCDGPNSLPLKSLEPLLRTVMSIKKIVG
jgi:2-dehydro-3-deoxyphosphooctonate aldolase (KDO 8-P synthase)